VRAASCDVPRVRYITVPPAAIGSVAIRAGAGIGVQDVVLVFVVDVTLEHCFFMHSTESAG